MMTNMQIPGLTLNPTSTSAGPATQVLCLMNMIVVEDLEDDEEYDGISLFSLFHSNI